MWIGRPRFALATGRRAPTLSSVCKGQLPAVRPEIAFGALARCFKCSADSLEIVGAISAKPTFGLTRVSQKGQIEHCKMRLSKTILKSDRCAQKRGWRAL